MDLREGVCAVLLASRPMAMRLLATMMAKCGPTRVGYHWLCDRGHWVRVVVGRWHEGEALAVSSRGSASFSITPWRGAGDIAVDHVCGVLARRRAPGISSRLSRRALLTTSTRVRICTRSFIASCMDGHTTSSVSCSRTACSRCTPSCTSATPTRSRYRHPFPPSLVERRRRAPRPPS